MSKFKELWIKDECNDFDCFETIVSNIRPTNELVWNDFRDSIHVIEYRAFGDLLIEAKKLRDRVVEYAESGCIEAFHADKDSLSDAIDRFDEYLIRNNEP